MRLRTFLLITIGFLLLAAPAAAQGPVFMIVPTNSPLSQPALRPGASSSLRARLRADRTVLRQTLQAHQQAAEALARESTSTSLLSNWLETEKTTVQLRQTLDADQAQAAALRRHIHSIKLQTQTPPTPVPSPMSGNGSVMGSAAAWIAGQYLGIPYRWGGDTPDEGFDCSGLTKYVYGQLGIDLPHWAAGQWQMLPHIDPSQLAPGDLVFFEPQANGPGHVGIYTGGDSFIEAPHTGDVVKVASLSEEAATMGFVGAARPGQIATGDPFG